MNFVDRCPSSSPDGGVAPLSESANDANPFIHAELLYWPDLLRAEARVAQLEQLLKEPCWILAQKLRLVRQLAAPVGSKRARFLRSILDVFRRGSCRSSVHAQAPRLLTCLNWRVHTTAYDQWIAQNEPDTKELAAQRATPFRNQPRISVVVPTYNTPVTFLTAMIDSVREQTYANWELCIADGNSTKPWVRQIIERYIQTEPRIRVNFLQQNMGIAGNSNAALDLATGDLVAFLDHDDTLAPFALYEVVRALRDNSGADLLYSDEDKITSRGDRRIDPHFKPAWSPDLLRCCNYITHLAVYRRSLLQQVGGLREGFDGSQDYDLVLRFTEKTKEIVHIPKVLYHWRIHPDSTSANFESKIYAYSAGRKAIQEHHDRTERVATVGYAQQPGWYHTTFTLSRRPLVSLIISTQDQVKALRRCLRSIWQTNYEPYEIVIVDNQSRRASAHAYYDQLRRIPNIRVVSHNRPLNYPSAVNLGVTHAAGELVLLLNSDTEAISRDWLDRMVEHAVRPEVGAVGAKLYHPDNTLQHGGIVFGKGGRVEYLHCHTPRNDPGQFGRLLALQNLSAVTNACLLTRKSLYNEIGGFDLAFPLAYNDIDFCFKLRQRNYLIVWTPLAELYHHGSLTCGRDDVRGDCKRICPEYQLLCSRWDRVLEGSDPYYSPNLRQDSGDFELETRGTCDLRPRTPQCAPVLLSSAAA